MIGLFAPNFLASVVINNVDNEVVDFNLGVVEVVPKCIINVVCITVLRTSSCILIINTIAPVVYHSLAFYSGI